MKKMIKRFLHIITIAIFACSLTMPAAICADTNIPFSEIGDYGNWLTDSNAEQVRGSLRNDMENFQSNFQQEISSSDYVPIEAKVGLAMINGFLKVINMLNLPLINFAIIFMLIAYAFWVVIEAYNMITKGTDAKEFTIDILKKAAVIAAWLIVIKFNITQIFMWIMTPILGVSTYLSDLILDSVTHIIGADLPNTCAAIKVYTANNMVTNTTMNADMVASLLCVPTRLSGFFTTAISVGWKWLIAGIGHSAFTMLMGAIFIFLFIYNGFKFALMGLGVIMDLFLGLLMLPFTAIVETIKQTSYKGIVGDIFNGFIGLFKPEQLSEQFNRFIKAAIYFVSLSIVIAVCAALLSGTVNVDMAASVPSLENDGFIPTFLTGALVAYLASRAAEIAQNLGGSVNDTFTKKVSGDVKNLWKSATGKGKEIIKLIRNKK